MLQGWSGIAAKQVSGQGEAEHLGGTTSTLKEQSGSRGSLGMLPAVARAAPPAPGAAQRDRGQGKGRVGRGLAEPGAGRAEPGPAQGCAPRREPAVRGPGGRAAVYF